MNHRLLGVLAAAVLVAAPRGQVKNAVVPKKYAAGGTRMQTQPFAQPLLRYQQVYDAKELQKVIKNPVRFKSIRFRAKQTGNQGFSITLQVAIGSLTGFTSGRFDDNLKNAVVVFPRNKITLPTSTAGAWVIAIPFNQDFTWDQQSNVVVEVRLFGNGNRNRPFLYWFDSYVSDFQVGGDMLWAIGPNTSNATVRQRGSGLVTRFDFTEGVAIKYGAGCKGLGNFVPDISANGVPVVGNTSLRVNLTRAKPQVPALLVWGGSRTKWGAFTLPLDLGPIGITGCTLLAQPLQIFAAVTLGGSAGSGVASVPFGIPAANVFKGINLYAQWFVLDDSQKVRVLPFALSDAIWLSIG